MGAKQDRDQLSFPAAMSNGSISGFQSNSGLSLTRRMVEVIPRIESADSLVALWIAPTCTEISSVAIDVWVASALPPEATTAEPWPASPARAAWIVALSASRLVCPAISLMSFTTSPIF